MSTPLIICKLNFLFLFLLIFISIIHYSKCSFIGKLCNNTIDLYSPNSTYHTNPNALLSSLNVHSNNSIGFYNTTAGTGGDIVYGDFLCRGDFDVPTCQECVTYATANLPGICPRCKNAVVWYDDCMVKYSNESFFKTVLTDMRAIYAWNMYNTTNVAEFNKAVSNIVNNLAVHVVENHSGRRFGTMEGKVNGFQTLYTMEQCTPILTASDCSLCLKSAISQLPSCCSGRIGGRVLTASCNIRYEITAFYGQNTTAALPLQPDAPPPLLDGISVRKKSRVKTIVAISAPSVAIAVALIAKAICFVKKNKKGKFDVVAVEKESGDGDFTAESLQFDLETLQAATNFFSDDNKIGEGGFGCVYKGTLSNGQEIAVKRLSRGSRQGAGEFKNEMVLVAKLQHRNLVRIFGFCFASDEKLLVYEFVPNKSLDTFLSDPEKKVLLDWDTRIKIIRGIVRGMNYLHEDSRL